MDSALSAEVAAAGGYGILLIASAGDAALAYGSVAASGAMIGGGTEMAAGLASCAM
jgi:hypothetical protein